MSYEYDAVGNRIRSVRDGVATGYTYDQNDRLLTAGATSYEYDSKGNLLSQTGDAGPTRYAWDFENRLLSAMGPSGGTQFEYDADGNRVERQRRKRGPVPCRCEQSDAPSAGAGGA